MNELLFFLSLIVSYLMVLFLFRKHGKIGLFVWTGFAMVLANIETVKGIEMFGMAMTLGNVIYLTTDFVTSICNEVYDKQTARKAVWFGFYASLAFTILSQITINFIPTNDSAEISEAMTLLFSNTPRVVGASLLTFLISSYVDTGIYEFFKTKVFKGDKVTSIFFRSELSSGISQFVDCAVFTILAFAGVSSVGGNTLIGLVELTFTSYVAKMIIGALDTPFLYIAKRLHK